MENMHFCGQLTQNKPQFKHDRHHYTPLSITAVYWSSIRKKTRQQLSLLQLVAWSVIMVH